MKYLRLFLMMLLIIMSLFLLYKLSRADLPWSPRRDVYVYSELLETSESSLLQTAEYRFTFLFPYDFIDAGEVVDWQFLHWNYETRNKDDFLRKSTADFYPDRQLPPEWKYGNLYQMCREYGIDPAGRNEKFIVFSTRTKAGFSFDKDHITLVPVSGDGNTDDVIIQLPRAEISTIIIEDRVPGNQVFPEVKMNPDQWSSFIGDISPQIADMAIREGILDLAEESAASLLSELFNVSGVKVLRIEFKDED